jgi:formate dehydrogenase iron-sulfur subunit
MTFSVVWMRDGTPSFVVRPNGRHTIQPDEHPRLGNIRRKPTPCLGNATETPDPVTQRSLEGAFMGRKPAASTLDLNRMALDPLLPLHPVSTLPFARDAAGPTCEEPTTTTGKKKVSLPLVNQLLDVQRSLTVVERFAHQHEDDALPAQARYYEDLIPLTTPGPGEQYSFQVDLDKCTGCKACVTACHTLNGLDADELWRTVGLLHGGTPDNPTQQTVTSSCHHCVDPACMNGCPVNAYEKDPITGIVKHLDDQCFGCQYCTLMCPYDAPKFNPERGIVRKCDMCSDRLSHGEAPACVQACPNEAIAIRIIEQAEAIQTSEAGVFLPSAPAPEHTVPTTTYKTKRPLPRNLLPADFYAVRAEHPHLPLVGLLTLSQLAVGVTLVKGFIEKLTGEPAPAATQLTVMAALLTGAALAVGVFHLGRPWLAWRSILNLRSSWFSREALMFGIFAGVVVLHAAVVVALSLPYNQYIPEPLHPRLAAIVPPLQDAATVVGVLAVFCSVMVYVVTKRPQWSGMRTTLAFFGTTVLLGLAAVLALTSSNVSALDGASQRALHTLLEALIAAAVIKLAYEGELLRHVRERQHTIEKRMAIVMLRDLRWPTGLRFVMGFLGGIIIPSLVHSSRVPSANATLLWVGLGLCITAELAERYLFFRAAPASRMPGGLP